MDLISWVLFGTAAIMAMFVGGRSNLPLAAWLWPAVLLYAMQTSPLPVSIYAGVISIVIGLSVTYRGMVPLPLVGYLIFVLVLASLTAVPFILDRLIAPQLALIPATLVFPVAVVAVEMFLARISPYGTWGSLAYTQFGSRALMQTVCFTGLFGLSFVISWTASSVAWGLKSNAVLLIIGPVLVVLLVFVFGSYRIAHAASQPSVKVAGITGPKLSNGLSFEKAAILFMSRKKLDDHDWSYIDKFATAQMRGLFELTEQAAQDGAKIITWAEVSGLIPKEKESKTLLKAQEIAKKYNCYIALSLGTLHRLERKWENKVVMVTPEGNIAWEYHKAKPVPGPEAWHTIRGDSSPKYIDTPYGRIGSVVCFDADFPHITKWVGRNNIDILLVPSADWKAISPLHSQMASFRGIENGASIVRTVRAGMSLVTDPYGKVLASMDYFLKNDGVMMANVPIKGTRTLYSRFPF